MVNLFLGSAVYYVVLPFLVSTLSVFFQIKESGLCLCDLPTLYLIVALPCLILNVVFFNLTNSVLTALFLFINECLHSNNGGSY